MTTTFQDIVIEVDGEDDYASGTAVWEVDDRSFAAPYGDLYEQHVVRSVELLDIQDLRLDSGKPITEEIDSQIFEEVKRRGYKE